jgi:hypothetical protein
MAEWPIAGSAKMPGPFFDGRFKARESIGRGRYTFGNSVRQRMARAQHWRSIRFFSTFSPRSGRNLSIKAPLIVADPVAARPKATGANF